MTQWTWDPQKEAENRKKHDLAFATAQSVFDDPSALTVPDPYPDEERWRTIGVVGPVVLFVVHTWPDDADIGRIITARKATASERKNYQDGKI